MSKDDDYVYSYIERKMISTNKKHSFDSKKYKKYKSNKISRLSALLVGIMLGIATVSFIIIKDISNEGSTSESASFLKSSLSIGKERKIKRMDDFLNIANNISKETNSILTNMVSVYTNKDFSESTKKKLENELAKLSNYDLNEFKEEEYSMFKGKLEEQINITKNSIEYYSILKGQTSDASIYLNKLLDDKRKLDASYTEDIINTITKVGLDYKILDDGRIKFY
ncbi:hypothetical protein UT300007_12890 [Clostridium sp. CTA-7]